MRKVPVSFTCSRQTLGRIDAYVEHCAEHGPRPSRSAVVEHLIAEHLAVLGAPDRTPERLRVQTKRRGPARGPDRVRRRARGGEAA